MATAANRGPKPGGYGTLQRLVDIGCRIAQDDLPCGIGWRNWPTSIVPFAKGLKARILTGYCSLHPDSKESVAA